MSKEDEKDNKKNVTVSLDPKLAKAKVGVKLDTENMTYEELMTTANRMAIDNETIMPVDRHIVGEPLDVARAFMKAIKEKYGWSESKAVIGFFSFTPPVVTFSTGYRKSEEVPWGTIKIPGLEAEITTCASHPDPTTGASRFSLHIQVRKKDIHLIDELIRMTEKIYDGTSVYKGQAIELHFNPRAAVQEGAAPVKQPRFLEPSTIRDEDIIFSKDVQGQLDVLIHTVVQCFPELDTDRIPGKQTVLLGGQHGTGKTLELARLQRMAVENGVTYILVNSAENLIPALSYVEIAKIEPAVMVCEDIDPVVAGERDLQMNQLLEAIDGIKSKGRKLLLVLTTNFPEKINPGFIRTGRIDAYIPVTPPDAEAVQRLIMQYGRSLIKEGEDLSEVGNQLAGHKASTVRGVVERSKLARLNRWVKAGRPEDKGSITAQDLLDAILTMKPHFALMAKENEKAEPWTFDDYMRELVSEESGSALPEHNNRVPRLRSGEAQTQVNGHGPQA